MKPQGCARTGDAQHGGFTLVELLVVIAIISILRPRMWDILHTNPKGGQFQWMDEEHFP